MDNTISSFPLPTAPKKKRQQNIIKVKEVPSAIKTTEEIEQERKFSDFARSRRIELSRKYSEKRRNSDLPTPAAGSRVQTVVKDPIIEGKANLKLLSQLDVDQLCAQYNQDCTMFASGGADGIVRLFNAFNGDLVKTLKGGKEVEGQTSCVTCIKVKPLGKSEPNDNLITCSYVNGVIKCFNYQTNQCLYTIKEKRQTYGLTFHPKLSKFISYGDDLKIYLYDIETQAKERVFQGSIYRDVHDGPTSRVFAGRFNPASSTEFLTGGWDATILLWDLRHPHAIRYISGVHLCGEGLDVTSGGRQVLTCSWRTEDPLQIWDYSTFKLIDSLSPDSHYSKLYCGRYISPEYISCGGGYPSIFRVLDTSVYKTRASVTGLPADVFHLCVGKPSRSAPPPKKNKFEDENDNALPDLSYEPRILFAAGVRVYEINFL
ncbi:hypothetical protein HHI36_006870 [Cryptolaemus montrouzieri]|uniref:Uncharacterized protein n=1 Tax=Cryptolaemus montrouzieri TaxID=559131 RepID=A0ABD2MN55_9CUCU